MADKGQPIDRRISLAAREDHYLPSTPHFLAVQHPNACAFERPLLREMRRKNLRPEKRWARRWPDPRRLTRRRIQAGSGQLPYRFWKLLLPLLKF
jgi:hypothetical protein